MVELFYDGLRPCPFCESKPQVFKKENGYIYIRCGRWSDFTGREHYVGIGGYTKQEAIKRWNGIRAVLDYERTLDTEVGQTLLSSAT